MYFWRDCDCFHPVVKTFQSFKLIWRLRESQSIVNVFGITESGKNRCLYNIFVNPLGRCCNISFSLLISTTNEERLFITWNKYGYICNKLILDDISPLQYLSKKIENTLNVFFKLRSPVTLLILIDCDVISFYSCNVITVKSFLLICPPVSLLFVIVPVAKWQRQTKKEKGINLVEEGTVRQIMPYFAESFYNNTADGISLKCVIVFPPTCSTHTSTFCVCHSSPHMSGW